MRGGVGGDGRIYRLREECSAVNISNAPPGGVLKSGGGGV